MTSKLLKAVCRHDNVEKSWRVIQENARGSTSVIVRKEVEDFAENSGKRIRSLCHRLSRNKFEFEKAKGIPAPKKDASGRNTGKFRPIVLAPIENRIVQRSLLEILLGMSGLSAYIKTPYSFGGIRKTEGSLAAVPAAIKEVLSSIGGGAAYYASADIESFFTRISKNSVLKIIRTTTDDEEFINFVFKAIKTELYNVAELREKVGSFPIEEIGVAQGNCLSPLLGNMILSDFDRIMNDEDCRCIRYIDDFIILGKSKREVENRLRIATALLKSLGMKLSLEKSSKGALSVSDGLSFLGIDVLPGLIRPSRKKQAAFVRAISDEFDKSTTAFANARSGEPVPRGLTLISTMKRVEGIINGWGKHYWFCNDILILSNIDIKIKLLIRSYLGNYKSSRERLPEDRRHQLLGVPLLAEQERKPFVYPKAS